MPGWLPLLVMQALLALPSASGAEVYKWTDEEGVVHYSDAAPAEQVHQAFRFEGYSEIEMRGNISAAESVARGRRELQARTHPGNGNDKKKRRKEIEAREHEAHCQALVERIERINSRLRAGGYSVNQGNRLRAERRELSGKRAWDCLRN